MTDLTKVQLPIANLPIVAKISVPGSPDWVGLAPDAVWISNKAKNNLTRIDARSNQVVATVPVGRAPCSGLAVGFGSVWVPCCGSNRVDRIDLASEAITASIASTIADSEGGIAVGEGGVWMLTDQDGSLAHIDPVANEVVAQVALAPGSFVPAVGAGSIWVSCSAGDMVSRVDPRTHQILAEIAVGPTPHFIACDDDAIWVLNQGDGTVSRIDPATNRIVATIACGVPGPGGDIAVGEGFVWATAINIPLTQIDPRTNQVVVQYVGAGGDALRVTHGAVWLCSFFLQEVWRVPLPL